MRDRDGLVLTPEILLGHSHLSILVGDYRNVFGGADGSRDALPAREYLESLTGFSLTRDTNDLLMDLELARVYSSVQVTRFNIFKATLKSGS